MKKILLLSFIAVLIFCGFNFNETSVQDQIDPDFVTRVVDSKKGSLHLFYKNMQGDNFKNASQLKLHLEGEGKKLLFAMNGGMYMEDLRPLGLYIENGVQHKRLNEVQEAYGNFYLQPNGVFFITKDDRAVVIQTKDIPDLGTMKYATQSGPMLIVDGALHPKFNKGSANVNVRNGVGILPNGEVLFAMSKVKVNLFDFASFFKEQGCHNALYLDGFVSKTYLPSGDWEQVSGRFGVLIAEVE